MTRYFIRIDRTNTLTIDIDNIDFLTCSVDLRSIYHLHIGVEIEPGGEQIHFLLE